MSRRVGVLEVFMAEVAVQGVLVEGLLYSCLGCLHGTGAPGGPHSPLPQSSVCAVCTTGQVLRSLLLEGPASTSQQAGLCALPGLPGTAGQLGLSLVPTARNPVLLSSAVPVGRGGSLG